MDELTKKLIIRTWQNSRENRISLCVTRTTKLMYLIEWEYFAWERERLTSLDWIYLHYGPWSSKLSTILQKEFNTSPEKELPGSFRQVFWAPPEFNHVDTKLKTELEGIVQRVFETFGPMPTMDIVRYIYFNTEPMQYAKRKQALDFMRTRKPLKPFNSVKALNKKIRQELREGFRLATQAKLAEKPEITGDVSPEVLEVLSQGDISDLQLAEGEVEIRDNIKLNITEEG